MAKGYYYEIVVIGTGGTGGAFLARFAQFLSGYSKDCYRLTIVDGDTVEKKNISRQPFTAEDIGKNKAAVLADILNDMYDLSIRYVDRYIDSSDDIKQLFTCGNNYVSNVIRVLIGAVDNHACRLEMHKYFDESNADTLLYIDSGNEFSFGQVVFGVNSKKHILSPDISFYFPEVLNGGVARKDESCEVLNHAAPQHLATNNLAGNIMFTAVSHLMSDGIVPTGITHFDTFLMFMRHDEVPEGFVAEAVKKKTRKKKTNGTTKPAAKTRKKASK